MQDWSAQLDTLKTTLLWLALAAVSSPVWGTFGWMLWSWVIRPRLIPRDEVERLASELLGRYGDRAKEIAYGEEYGAWRHSDGFEQGKWRRVRRQIEGRRR